MAAPSGNADADEDTPVSRGGGGYTGTTVGGTGALPKTVSSATVDADDEDDVPAATAPVVKPASGGNKAEDILAMIRARQKSN
jgi:hypothetical protein